MLTTRRTFLTALGGAAAAGARDGNGSPPRADRTGQDRRARGQGRRVGPGGRVRISRDAVRRRQDQRRGGILGRKVETVIEEESSPQETVERFRKLALQTKVDAITGTASTAVGLAIGPVAEELKTIWLSWDATTQKGVEETMPKPKYAFRSCDNECEAVMASILTARNFKGKIRTVAGINNDYSYGRDNWAAFQAIMKKFDMGVTPVAELWPKSGTTDYTSHVAALQQAKPDLIFCSFWNAEAPIFLKQAHAAGLTPPRSSSSPRRAACTSHEEGLHPRGLLMGYNSMYFEAPNASPLLKDFVKWHQERFREWPNYESDHAYFTVMAYRAAIEKAAKAAGGKWPTTDQIIGALEGIEVESLSGRRRYREDHIMEAPSTRASPPTRTPTTSSPSAPWR